ncbi:helix-turn-helix domain-containing protein [Oxalobacteraceae bacterium]|nr:helix-turn-helix domain-containing protein [Oxalobacteraceae bacterium]
MQNTLGEFIRAHRERLTPAGAGLPGGGRRRTPGLRREELAQLCEVSPTWLTWLEQGRQVSASGKMLARLAEVLHLTVAERAYLFSLADRLDPAGEAEGDSPEQGLDAIVQAITAPAYILNREWDAVAWNAQAAALFVGWLDRRGGQHPNQLRFMFTEPRAPELIVDWPERAERLVAEFRADCGKYAYQEPLSGMIAELVQASPAFEQLWQSQKVISREGGRRRFHHPEQGLLTLQQVTSHLAQRRELKLVMLLPAVQ